MDGVFSLFGLKVPLAQVRRLGYGLYSLSNYLLLVVAFIMGTLFVSFFPEEHAQLINFFHPDHYPERLMSIFVLLIFFRFVSLIRYF